MIGQAPTSMLTLGGDVDNAAARAKAWCLGRETPVTPHAVLMTAENPSGEKASQAEAARPKGWQFAAVAALIVAIALGLATYAAAASYESVSRLAAAKHVALSSYTPAGIDGGLFGVIVIDIVLTWAGQPLGWLRLMARVFAAGTVAANASAGWPDPVGVGLRVAAPMLFVVLTEAARAVLLRHNQDEGVQADGIPAARWFLAPQQTFRMWRRMKLWRVRGYATALDMELSRIQAIAKLTAHYTALAGDGHTGDWRKDTPPDLVWMLRNGVRMDQALDRVDALTARPEVAAAVPPVAHAAASWLALGDGPGMAHGAGPVLAPPVAHADGPSVAPGGGSVLAPPVAPGVAPDLDPAVDAGRPTRRPRRSARHGEDPDAAPARREYRKSVRRNEPLSDRALAGMFGRSRNWGAARIREAAGPAQGGPGGHADSQEVL